MWNNMGEYGQNEEKCLKKYNDKNSEHTMFPSVERESSKAGFSYMGLPGVVEGPLGGKLLA